MSRLVALSLVAVIAVSCAGSSAPVDELAEPSAGPVPATTVDEAPEEPEPPTIAESGHGFVLPDPERWVVIEVWDEDGQEVGSHIPAWAWSDDRDRMVVLVDTGSGPSEPPRAEAEPTESGHRTFTFFSEAGRRIGLVGFGHSKGELAAIVDALESGETGWSLPGYDVVATPGDTARRTHPVSPQIDLAPLVDGIPQLDQRVSMRLAPGTISDVFGAAFDPSAMGPLERVPLDGGTGLIIRSDDRSNFTWAAAVIGGTVVSLQGNSPQLDLVPLLESLEPIDGAAWHRHLADAEDRLLAALDAEQVELVIPPGGELPRFVLPAPWAPEFITDKGIWTDDEQRRHAALIQANAPSAPGPPLERLVQAFGSDDSPLPELIVFIHLVDEAPPPLQRVQYSEEVTVAGLAGIREPSYAGRHSAFLRGEVAEGHVVMGVESSPMSEARFVQLLESLQPLGGDPLAGFESAELVSLFEDDTVPEVGAAAFTFGNEWHARWQHPTSGSVGVSVERLDRELLLLRIALSVADSSSTIETEPDGSLVFRGAGTTTWWDADTELALTVHASDADDIRALLEPLPIDEWTEFAEPYNADPVNPR